MSVSNKLEATIGWSAPQMDVEFGQLSLEVTPREMTEEHAEILAFTATAAWGLRADDSTADKPALLQGLSSLTYSDGLKYETPRLVEQFVMGFPKGLALNLSWRDAGAHPMSLDISPFGMRKFGGKEERIRISTLSVLLAYRWATLRRREDKDFITRITIAGRMLARAQTKRQLTTSNLAEYAINTAGLAYTESLQVLLDDFA